MSSICILSFSPIHRDARVLRQIEYLSRRHRLIVIGFGPPHPDFAERSDVRWLRLDTTPTSPRPEGRSLKRSIPAWPKTALRRLLALSHRMVRVLLLAIGGRLVPAVCRPIFWTDGPMRIRARDLIRSEEPCDAILANDWDALPIAVEATRHARKPVVYDAHEYAPLEWANRRSWRLVEAPIRRWVLGEYSGDVTASMTVAPAIARRLAAEYALDPIVVLNAPNPAHSLAVHESTDRPLRMIHHGGASPDREPERMIRAVALCDGAFTLDFMLVGDGAYIDQLHAFAKTQAPGLVRFRDPVPTQEIVTQLVAYDLGFYVLPQSNYNHRVALPNKLFDFIAAGLPICVGPTEAMADLVRRYDCGVVAPSFDPADIATALRSTDHESLRRMSSNSVRAATGELNADHQMSKVLALCDELLSSDDRSG